MPVNQPTIDDFLDELLQRLGVDADSVDDVLYAEMYDYIEQYAETYWSTPSPEGSYD